MFGVRKTLATLLATASLVSPALAATVYYQPTPYPSSVTAGVHVLDGWLPSQYYGKTFQKDDKLQVGGWGDTYRTYIQFDLTGLPANVSSARLKLYAFPKGDASTLTGIDVYNPGAAWASSSLTTSMTWDTQPTGNTLVTSVAAGANNAFWDIPITSLYNGWRAGTSANRGLMISPKGINNNFSLWRSSRYSGDGQRPLLELTFTPPVTVPNFKIPLPRNVSWLVTTEAGGYDCNGVFNAAHSGTNYFSIDFSWRNKNATGAAVYGSPDAGANIPVTPAADGIVADVISSSSHANFANNGYFVAIAHNSTGSLTSGFSTRYLHLKAAPQVTVGQPVYQGQTVLGYMGNTGASQGAHLHFGVRYNNSGAATTNAMYAVVSGWLLKSFQTECSAGSPVRYYLSS
jgi:murein DD-endopeptidase MepM/ murein hydrolase activator NlpD